MKRKFGKTVKEKNTQRKRLQLMLQTP